MARSNPKEIEEVFVIQTEAIDFFGALTKETGGEFVACGRVLFHNKEQWSFHSPAGEKAALSNKLVTLCEAIAGFYGTGIFRQKFDRAVGYEKLTGLLREVKHKMN